MDENLDAICDIMGIAVNKITNETLNHDKKGSVIEQDNLKLAVANIKYCWKYYVNYGIDTILEKFVRELIKQKKQEEKPSELQKFNKTNMFTTFEGCKNFLRKKCERKGYTCINHACKHQGV